MSDDPDQQRTPADDQALAALLRRQEKKLAKLERNQIGCNMQCTPIVVVNVPPENPQCGVCYILYGTEGCMDAPPGCEETCTPACLPDVMGSPEWTPISTSPPGETLMEWMPTATPPHYRVPQEWAYASLLWPEPLPGPQSIEVTVAHFGAILGLYDQGNYVHLFLRQDGVASASPFGTPNLNATFQKATASDTVVYWRVSRGTTDFCSGSMPWPSGEVPPFTVRLESDEDGAFRFLVGGALLCEGIDSVVPSGVSNIGVMLFNNYSPGTIFDPVSALGSAWITGICINGIGDCDDFERTEVGGGWILGPGPGWAGAVTPFAINTGAAVGTVSFTPGMAPYVSNSMSWAKPQPADQSIEVTVENIMTPTSGQYLIMMTNLSPDVPGNRGSCACDVQTGGGDIGMSGFHFTADGEWVNTLGSVALHFDAPPEPFKVRLDSLADGMQRFSINGVEMVTWLDPAPIVGTHCGFGLDYWNTTASPRVLEACIGVPACAGGAPCGPDTCDDFEHANGSLGADWVTYVGAEVDPVDGWEVYNGAAICGPSVDTGPRIMPTASIGSTAAEFTIESFWNDGAVWRSAVQFQINLNSPSADLSFPATNSGSGNSLVIQPQTNASGSAARFRMFIGSDVGDSSPEFFSPFASAGSLNPTTFRLEADGGLLRALINGVEVIAWTTELTTGDHLFFTMRWSPFDGKHPPDSAPRPRILATCWGGVCAPPEAMTAAAWLDAPAAGFAGALSGPPLRPEMRRERTWPR